MFIATLCSQYTEEQINQWQYVRNVFDLYQIIIGVIKLIKFINIQWNTLL